MMDKAREAGLQFVKNDEEFVYDRKYVHDKLYDSRSGFGNYYRYQPRDIQKICSENAIAVPLIHVGAFQRIAQGTFAYAPGSLPMEFDVVDNQGPHPNSASIKNLVSAGMTTANSQPSLLDRAARHIQLRRGLYYIFLAYTFFTLYWLLRGDVAGKGFLRGAFAAVKTLVAPDSLLDKLALLLWHNPVLVGIGILIVVAVVFVRKAMARIFSRFWFPLRHDLKPLVSGVSRPRS